MRAIKIRLPAYVAPRIEWRKRMYPAMVKTLEDNKISYAKDDRLELNITLYLEKGAIDVHDVDNRLKDIMDALQGRAGGPKDEHHFQSLIPNDNQIYKVTIEKKVPPKQSLKGR